jgi:hypothetical protein
MLIKRMVWVVAFVLLCQIGLFAQNATKVTFSGRYIPQSGVCWNQRDFVVTIEFANIFRPEVTVHPASDKTWSWTGEVDQTDIPLVIYGGNPGFSPWCADTAAGPYYHYGFLASFPLFDFTVTNNPF